MTGLTTDKFSAHFPHNIRVQCTYYVLSQYQIAQKLLYFLPDLPLHEIRKNNSIQISEFFSAQKSFRKEEEKKKQESS